MANRLERLKTGVRRRPLVMVGAMIALALAGGLALRASHPSEAAAATETLVVQPRLFQATIDVVGVIKPGAPTDIVAPFDGSVAALGFVYGDPVAAGETLVRIEDFDISQRAREAQIAFLKAQEAAGEMAAWASSPDVARARRAKQSAELEVGDTRRKLDETKTLLDRGLVPRSEYDSLAQQLRSQQITAEAATEDLASALKRGQGPNREVARLDLETSRAKLADLQSQQQAALVRAPIAGVIIRPPATAAAEDGVHVGQRLSRGQLIGSISRPDQLIVEVALSEGDAGRVKVGQSAIIYGGGVGAVQLKGIVASVAGEARASMAPGGPSVVAARIRVDTPVGQGAAVRIGSTANVSIVVHAAANALVVPPEAVIGQPPSGQLIVRDPRTGRDQSQSVSIGYTAPVGVEITSGLRPGQTVIWRVASPDGGRR